MSLVVISCSKEDDYPVGLQYKQMYLDTCEIKFPFEMLPTYNRIGTISVSNDGQYELRLRSEYRYDWNTDSVKFQYVEGGVTYEKTFQSLSALNSSTGPIILEPVVQE